MKKTILILSVLLLLISNLNADSRKITHSYHSNYTLFPEFEYRNTWIRKLSSNYDIRYCVQSVYEIPKSEAKGYSCVQILDKLDQLGGLDKECYGVSYIDANTGERKPIFKKSTYNKDTHELYVKDKAAGGLHMKVDIETFNNIDNSYIVNAVIIKNPDNIFVRGLKKNEAEIFVLMQEDSEKIKVYALIQCSYSPIEHKFLKSFVERAVTARVLEIQHWFYSMLCT